MSSKSGLQPSAGPPRAGARPGASGRLAILILALSGALPVAAAGPLKLEDAIDRVLAANPSVVAERARLEAVEARTAREELPPPYVLGSEVENVAGTGELRGVDSAEATLRISRVIELGGKQAARRAVGRAEVDLQQHRLYTTRADLVRRTAGRFIEVLALQQRLELAEERVAQAQRTRSEVAAWVEAARNPGSDLQAAEIALAEAELNRETTEQELSAARTALSASWGILAPDFERVAGDLQALPGVESFEVLSGRLSAAPESRASRLQAETAVARRRLAEASARPDLDVSLGVRHFQDYRDQALVMSVSMPLGSRRRAGYSIDQANAELAALEARRDAEHIERQQLLFASYQELVRARTEIASLRTRMLPRAADALAMTRRGFEAGRFSYIQLAQAERTLFDLNRRLIDASARYHLLLVEVERLTATVEDPTS